MNKLCRICLEEGVLSSLLSSVFSKNFNITLCDMIEYCCNVKISKDDGLPEQLCSNCIYKLGIAYHFKQTCESADLRMRQYLGIRPPLKSVDVAVMTDPMRSNITTIIKKCKCNMSQPKKSSTNYKKKPESEKQKRGPKPKPKQVHKCYECHKEFNCQAQLEMHIRTHTGDRPFACECGRRFTQKHNLTIHRRLHVGEQPYQCHVCSKRFSARGNLTAHLKIHTGQKDHVCEICNKAFITSSELTRHSTAHTGRRPHRCDLCSSAYAQARDLKLHKLKKHAVSTDKLPAEPVNMDARAPAATSLIPVTEGPPALRVISGGEHVSASGEIGPASGSITRVLGPTTGTVGRPLEPPPLAPAPLSFAHASGHACATCGDSFDYLSELTRHYLIAHKEESLLNYTMT